MSEENVEIARAVLDALNRGDIDAALKNAAPDFEWDFSRSIGMEPGVYRLDETRKFWGEFFGAWESSRWEAEEFIEAGPFMVTPITLYLRGRDGVEVQTSGAWVWTFRDGKVASAAFYQERQEALEAAGLSE
jgi:ketosteroid isomerase-like protein